MHTKTCTGLLTADSFAIAPNWKTTKMSFNEWLVKLWSVHTMGCYLASCRDGLLIHITSIWISRAVCWGGKKTSKHSALYDCICKTFLKWENYGDGKQIGGCQGFGVEGGGGSVWLSRSSLFVLCGVGAVLYLDCDGDFRNPHMRWKWHRNGT